MWTEIQVYIDLPKMLRQNHLRLDEACIEIGGNSREARLLLAHFLKTTVPKGMKIHCCHACNNDKCSNTKHLYWGTASENAYDARAIGRGIKNNGRLAERPIATVC